jgi:hypothetical protein
MEIEADNEEQVTQTALSMLGRGEYKLEMTER